MTLTGAEIAAIISAVAVLVATIGNFLLQLQTKEKVESVHQLVNGQTEKLTALTAKSAFAEGVLSAKAPEASPPV